MPVAIVWRLQCWLVTGGSVAMVLDGNTELLFPQSISHHQFVHVVDRLVLVFLRFGIETRFLVVCGRDEY